VGFGTSGTIQTLDIKSGQTVKAGQIIGTVDAENAQLTLESDQANLDQATQALALAESGNEAAVQITQDNLQVDQLDASITSAKTALATADTNLADAETACADGTASTTSATVAGTTSTTEESTGSSSGTSGSPSEASNSGVGTTCADESADASAVFCDHR
jgi:macrolide-specific efflux system membrane fusion protein